VLVHRRARVSRNLVGAQLVAAADELGSDEVPAHSRPAVDQHQ